MVKAVSPEQRDVQTDLPYWSRQPNDQIHIDFMKPGGQKQFAELDKLQVKQPVFVHDVRENQSDYTLDKHGFQYVHNEVPELDDWSDEQKVTDILIPRSEQLVRDVTGAKEVITFTHRIRCFATDEAKLANNRSPAHSVHSDFTVVGALKHLENTIQDPARVEQLLKGRVLAINVWRPLKTIQRDPLTVCDWNTVAPRKDIISVRMNLPNGWNELGYITANEKHRWHYMSDQQPHEALIFKQFDSSQMESGGCTLPHSAFEDPSRTSGDPRESIEI